MGVLMRILVISAGYPSEVNKHGFGFVHARVKLYRRYSHSVYVIVPSRRMEDYQAYEYEGVRVFRVPVEYIEDFVESADPDVIAYHFPDPVVLAKLVALKRPLVLWIHGADALVTFLHNYYIPFYFKSLASGLASIPFDIFRNLQLRNLILRDMRIQMVVPSLWMKSMLMRYLGLPYSHNNRIHIIPNPVDTDKFKPMNSCYERKRDLGISVRALNYKYGVDVAIKAIAGLRNVKLIVVGNGPLREYLKNLAEKYQANVEFIYEGIPHEKLSKYYNEVGFFVAPSRTEAQGVAMCEALASGTPAVATRVGGIPEFVIDGYNGILADKPDPIQLRKAVLTMISIPIEDYCALSRNAVKYARKTYSHKVIIPKELKVLSKAIEVYNVDKAPPPWCK